MKSNHRKLKQNKYYKNIKIKPAKNSKARISKKTNLMKIKKMNQT